jgi:hypothetical protein
VKLNNRVEQKLIECRLAAHLNNGDSADSIILKLPTDSDNRKVGQSLGVYEREIRIE